MNPSMIQRAIRRHHYMKDMPAYRHLLEHASGAGDAWLVPQAEVAQWWERRQRSRLEAQGREGRLELRCDLPRACVEIDGDEVCALPNSIEVSADAAGDPSYEATLQSPLFEELLGHLGFGHLRPTDALAREHPLTRERLAPILAQIEEEARVHKRYPEAAMEALTAAIAEEHRRVGWPVVRLWTLPEVDGRPRRVALSSRYDVDKAIVNLPSIHDLEEAHGLRSTVYLRPMGLFYGRREILDYLPRAGEHEIALHGEFLSTAERFGGEAAAAIGEKRVLEEMVGRPVQGVCMHGGELRSNTSPTTRESVESAEYLYETMFRNRYYLPLHLPHEGGVRRTLSIGQHYADISVRPEKNFSEELGRKFVEHYEAARAVGGVFVPVMHPLYFDLANYLRYPSNCMRIAAFVPKFLVAAVRMNRSQAYLNRG